jgi:NodT family efflux transporter outer membrane factor (OMF) lipoprotein
MSRAVNSSKLQQVYRVLVKAIACSVFLFLPSCAIPALRPPEMGPELPDTFQGIGGSESSAQIGIEQFFNDQLLTSLIDQALDGNQELKILNEEVEIARNEFHARRGAYLPFVTVRTEMGVEKPSLFTPLGAAEEQLDFRPGSKFPDPLPNFLMGFNLFWPLDIWRELRNARDASVLRFFAANERRNYFTTRLVAEVAETYYRLLALDKRLETLDKIIELQESSRKLAVSRKEAGRDTELPVQRFQAEVHKNQSEKLIVRQEIVEEENRINFLLNRLPQHVERMLSGFLEHEIHPLDAGVPAQLLLNRPDIRQAENELVANGLDVRVARAHFFPKVDIAAGVGYQAFNAKYLFVTPAALIYNAAGGLVAPLINKKAIQAEYMSANAKQLQSIYNYQRVVLNAYTEVINRLSMVKNYSKSIAIKQQQLASLEASVESATKLFQNARVEYVEVLLAQRDLLEARNVLIENKKRQLSAIVNAYQALGGGDLGRFPANQPLFDNPPSRSVPRRFRNRATPEGDLIPNIPDSDRLPEMATPRRAGDLSPSTDS